MQRLGIETATAAVETVSRTRSAGGEIIAPPGGAVTVTAPTAGTLQAAGGGVPRAGSRVTRGQAIFSLFALQAPERNVRLESERDAAAAEAELTLADPARATAGAAPRRRRDERAGRRRGARATEGCRSQLPRQLGRAHASWATARPARVAG